MCARPQGRARTPTASNSHSTCSRRPRNGARYGAAAATDSTRDKLAATTHLGSRRRSTGHVQHRTQSRFGTNVRRSPGAALRRSPLPSSRRCAPGSRSWPPRSAALPRRWTAPGGSRWSTLSIRLAPGTALPYSPRMVTQITSGITIWPIGWWQIATSRCVASCVAEIWLRCAIRLAIGPRISSGWRGCCRFRYPRTERCAPSLHLPTIRSAGGDDQGL
jgi:hypothetical protein